MGFDLSGFFSYQTNSDSYSSSASIKGANQANGIMSENTISTKNLADFPKGSSITGQVVSMENDMVLLKLSDNSYVNARLEQNLNVSVGQKLTFEVKSNSGNTLSLTPLFTNLNTNTNVIKGLVAANIPVNNTSIEMITAMMDKGMSIDTASLQTMYRQVLANSQATPSNLVAMKELNIPITKENIAQFEAYQNYEHQVLSGIEEIVRNVEQTCLDLISRGEVSEAAKLYRELTAMLSESATGVTGELAEGNALAGSRLAGDSVSLIQGEALSNGIAVSEDGTDIAIKDGVIENRTLPGNETAAEALSGNKDAAQAVLKNVEASMTEELLNLTSEEITGSDVQNVNGEKQLATANQVANAENKLAEANQTAVQNGTAEIIADTEAAINSELNGILNKSERASLAGYLTELGVSNEVTQAVKSGDISMKQLMSLLSQVSQPGQAGEKLERLYTSREFQTLLNKQLSNEFLLTPKQVAQEGKVSEFYNKLMEQTTRISEALNMLGKENSSLAKSVTTLQQNVDFINQINQTFAYVQLPLKLSQGNGHGDLYVYTNKRNLATKEGNITALLHLDMEHLGPVDVYVAMTNGDHVNTKFYLKDDEVLDFIESNIHLLNERLEKRGYHTKAEFLVKDSGEEAGFENKLLGKEEQKPALISTQAFDMRA